MHQGLSCLPAAIAQLRSIEEVLHRHNLFAENERKIDEGDVDHDLTIDNRLELTWGVSFSGSSAEAALRLYFNGDTRPEEFCGCLAVRYDAHADQWTAVYNPADRHLQSREATRLASSLAIPVDSEERVLPIREAAMTLVEALAEYCATRLGTATRKPRSPKDKRLN